MLFTEGTGKKSNSGPLHEVLNRYLSTDYSARMGVAILALAGEKAGANACLLVSMLCR